MHDARSYLWHAVQRWAVSEAKQRSSIRHPMQGPGQGLALAAASQADGFAGLAWLCQILLCSALLLIDRAKHRRSLSLHAILAPWQ
jgi:hypothetical protein